MNKLSIEKLNFFTYTSDSSETAPTEISLDLSSSDKFDAFEIFKTYLNSKQYSQSMKKDLVTKFFEIQERAKQEKDYA